jgi:glycylpeptide N-tetradecanoyltransferase
MRRQYTNAPQLLEHPTHELHGEIGGIGKHTPLPDPSNYFWGTTSEDRLRNFFNNHYLADDESYLEYTVPTLRWALEKDEWWNVALYARRKAPTPELVGFIAASPRGFYAHGQDVDAVVINFLCVHKKYRDKRLAPLLIKEITRRAVLRGIQQAIYTAAAELPHPVCSASYWHRLLDVPRLVDAGFCETNDLNNKWFEVKGSSHLRVMEDEDVTQAQKLLDDHARKHKLALLPRADEWVGKAFVDLKEGIFVALVEVGWVPKKDPKLRLRQAYVHHAVGEDALRHAAVIAKRVGFDVLNALDLGENRKRLEKEKFVRGTGDVNTYVYNWKLEPLEGEDVSLICV